MKQGSKYWPLFNHLHQNGQDEIILSFSKIENLLGSQLPDSARKSRAWWSNRSTGTVQASAWMDAGYLVEDIDFRKKHVVFRKAVYRHVYRIKRAGDTVLWDSELIKGLRLHLGVSQAQLAEKLGVRQQTISEWETGIYSPSVRTSKYLNKIAEEVEFKYDENN
jgi:DNA-binding XRE family transcriptional regulator